MLSLAWLTGNWFDVVQTAGIIGGLVFSGMALRTDARVRRVQNLFSLTKQHREIWSRVFDTPDLARVLDAKADIAANPITREEKLFVRFLILHLKSTHRAMNANFFTKPEGLERDIRMFFTLPIPGAVWSDEKHLQEKAFVQFVERHFAAR